jgi:hypothetical protein
MHLPVHQERPLAGDGPEMSDSPRREAEAAFEFPLAEREPR